MRFWASGMEGQEHTGVMDVHKLEDHNKMLAVSVS